MAAHLPPAIRLPDELKAKLRKIAEREIRSLNQQAIFILTKYVDEYENKNLLSEEEE